MKATNFNDVTVKTYLDNCKAMTIHEGYEMAGSSFEKAEIKKIIDRVTDLNDIDQAYDAARDTQNVINYYTQMAKSNKAWNEYETSCRKHYHDQIQWTIPGITHEEAEHEEYQNVLVQYGCMQTKDDGIWSIAHLSLKKLNEMVTELWKIRAHWLVKVEAGQYERKNFTIFSF